ncbi:hypothetical protein C0989_008048 [Termitomyces sp. Mn162]|nr:hypothetical protein C0989_008048 [Termitomyces sp. Mn162]
MPPNCLEQVPPAPTTDEWITILKLSTQWMMLDVRHVAINVLSSAKIPPVDRVVLAREYKVDTWLRSAYLELVKTASSMTQQDMEKIGLMAAFKIHKARERYSTGQFGGFGYPSTPPPPTDNFFRSKETNVKRSAVERVLLAREHGVAEWLREAFMDLIKRREPLTMDDSKNLGFDTAIRLYTARERLLGRRTRMVSTPSNNTPVDQELREELGALITYQPVERAVLARRCGVTEWLRQAFVELTERSEAISIPEAKALGYETAIRLAIAREAYAVKFNNGFAICQDITTISSSVDQELASEISATSSHGPVERVTIARKAGVDEWLQSALDELVKRKERVTDDEAVVLGLDTCIQLCRFRFENLERYSSPSFTDSGQINAEFQVELGEIRDAGERYIQPGITLEEEGTQFAPLTAEGVSKGSTRKGGTKKSKKTLLKPEVRSAQAEALTRY